MASFSHNHISPYYTRIKGAPARMPFRPRQNGKISIPHRREEIAYEATRKQNESQHSLQSVGLKTSQSQNPRHATRSQRQVQLEYWSDKDKYTQDVKIGQALMDYSDLKNSFFLERSVNAKYVLRCQNEESDSQRRLFNRTGMDQRKTLCTASSGSRNGNTAESRTLKEKLEFAERLNKILFFQLKQKEKKLHESGIESEPLNIVAPVSDKEKEMLGIIEQQKKKIEQLYSQLEEKPIFKSSDSEAVVFLKKRIEELNSESRHFFEKYQRVKEDYLKLYDNILKEKHPVKASLPKTNEREHSLRNLYEKRLFEIQRGIQTLLQQKTQISLQISELEEELISKSESEENIEKYAEQLLAESRSLKTEIAELLKKKSANS